MTARRPRRWLVRALIVLAVVGLCLAAAARVQATVGANAADDPRSPAEDGSAAVAALVQNQGVELTRTDSVTEAVDRIGADAARTTVLVVHPDRLSVDDVGRLRQSAPARLVLLQPGSTAQQRFGTGVRSGSVPQSPVVSPGCADDLAQRAGAIEVDPDAAGMLPPSPITGCYRSGDGSARYLRIGTGASQLDLVADGFANRRLATEGNAAFATGLLGSQPRLVWVMSPEPAVDTGAGEPRLLPDWWLLVVGQAAVGVLVLGLWRGRRLGPIMIEPLPVVVRASETVEGHGRLYQRIQARDRAAAALRAGVRSRLGPRFGATTDPMLLSETLAERTGGDAGRIHRLLAGPDPATDDDLNRLAHDLDQLEQEARQL